MSIIPSITDNGEKSAELLAHLEKVIGRAAQLDQSVVDGGPAGALHSISGGVVEASLSDGASSEKKAIDGVALESERRIFVVADLQYMHIVPKKRPLNSTGKENILAGWGFLLLVFISKGWYQGPLPTLAWYLPLFLWRSKSMHPLPYRTVVIKEVEEPTPLNMIPQMEAPLLLLPTAEDITINHSVDPEETKIGAITQDMGMDLNVPLGVFVKEVKAKR
ncbi:hypothetical protein AMTR_s00140p00041550 [Amborella trichopoda]|uniref:Uncharacterized protein n=1 Tax=Amborella trichopoda TaxID=13333 RepID=W1P4H5_AMBTC|nr:hypothetical protein AMTR_s00140p00041550 [Amborella trichopoda]